MTVLTAAQRHFLEQHKIPLSRVFDASNLSRADYQEAMRTLEMVVAVGTSPCKAAGHTIRTRAGHCAQCKPEVLAFMLRNDEPGEVYVAASKSGGVTKVGCSQNSTARMKTLNSAWYGGFNDWEVCFSQKCEHAGRVEFTAHQCLRNYATSGAALRSGKETRCLELFSCSPSIAINVLKKAIREPDKVFLIENTVQPESKDVLIQSGALLKTDSQDDSVGYAETRPRLPSGEYIRKLPTVSSEIGAYCSVIDQTSECRSTAGQSSLHQSLRGYVAYLAIWGLPICIFITSKGSWVDRIGAALGALVLVIIMAPLIYSLFFKVASSFSCKHPKE